MTYLYKCEQCEKKVYIIKPMREASNKEKCRKCNNTLNRVYTSSMIKTNDGTKV